MRIISQRQDISVDFDRNSFRVYDKYIYLTDLGLKQDIMIGQYESEDRAKEVFKDMHDQYQDEMLNLPNVEMFYMPKE